MSDREILTPDQVTTENQLICEKLLGWRRLTHNGVTWWEPPSTGEFQPTMLAALSFTTWAEAGLILDALQAKLSGSNFNTAVWDQLRELGHVLSLAKLSPSAVRKAALAYIKAWHASADDLIMGRGDGG